MGIFKKLFGTTSEKEVRALEPIVQVELSHPLRVPLGQIIVDGDNVHRGA